MPTRQTTTTETTPDDDRYVDLLDRVRTAGALASGPFFTTDADFHWVTTDGVGRPTRLRRSGRLFQIFLAALPAARRQHYTCSCCRHFVSRFGGLVTIDGFGELTPVFWTDAAGEYPPTFAQAARELARLVRGSRVTGVFVWGPKDAVWGTPQTGPWSHLAATPSATPFTSPLKTPAQRAAELAADWRVLSRSLAEYPRPVAAEAVRLLSAGVLVRSDQALAVATWFLGAHDALAAAPGRRDSALWRLTATAPAGFTHVRTTVVSTLLDGIKAGCSVDALARAWALKMSPLQYRRPTAVPTAGAVAEAERVVETLGLAAAFRRRFATLTDVRQTLWTPPTRPEDPPAARGVFGGLRAALGYDRPTPPPADLPPTPMTWEKFARVVLAAAPPRDLEVFTPVRGEYYALVTADDPTAPPIIRWDGLDGFPRNPVSWYVHGSRVPGRAADRAVDWNLNPETWVRVTALFQAPYGWQVPERFVGFGRRVMFALAGCREITPAKGAALFPEILRGDLKAIERVVEAHSNRSTIAPAPAGEVEAHGLLFTGVTPVRVRVTDAAGGRAVYDIDRWD